MLLMKWIAAEMLGLVTIGDETSPAMSDVDGGTGGFLLLLLLACSCGGFGGGGGGVRRFGCSGAMRRSMLFDAFASGEYAGRALAGNGEPGCAETRRMSSDMGVDFFDGIVYARLACAKLGRAGWGV